jgi:hypothetical protein
MMGVVQSSAHVFDVYLKRVGETLFIITFIVLIFSWNDAGNRRP